MRKIFLTIVVMITSLTMKSQITETIDGNVGIGDGNPNAKLEVRGTSAVYGDFVGYSGSLANSLYPNQKKPTFIITESASGNFPYGIGGQKTYRGGMSFGDGGPGIYSINPNPAGSVQYGDLRFHTTYWNGSSLSTADRMVIKVDGNIGIGTTTPSEKLEIIGNIKSTGAIIDGGFAIDDESYAHSNIRLGHELNDRIFADNSTDKYYGGGMFFRVHNDDATSDYINAMIIDEVGNIGIGTRETEGYKLAVAGTTGIIAEKVTVKVKSSWPDFVFTKDYNLPTLKEVEKHITEKGHLQNIPSAEEVKENGVELGNMSKNLLQKVEELTLYTIQQEKKLEKQDEEIKELKVLVSKLINAKK